MIQKETILAEYQVRKSRKQKAAFIEYVQGICEREGTPFSVEQKREGKVGAFEPRNMVMGCRPESCEMIVGGHYDTCAFMPLPNFITPRNPLVFVVVQILIMLGIFVAAAGAGVIIGLLSKSLLASAIGAWATMMLTCFQMMAGFANKHTANDNTSGTVTVLETMLAMTPEQRSRTCFVLFDLEELGMIGSTLFVRKHPDAAKEKPMINLDCVSDGDYILVKLAKPDKKSEFGGRLSEAFSARVSEAGKTPFIAKWGIYPSDQMVFKRGTAVAAMRRSKLVGLYMGRIHTPRDTVFDENNVACIKAAIIDLVEKRVTEE